MVYAREGDPDHEREALEKAVALDDHFAPAYVNLARLEIKEKHLPAAEEDLKKATAADPENVQALSLLTQVELFNQHYSDPNARKLHTLPNDQYALVHYMAARALEQERRVSEAVAELRTFLKEEPSNARAAAARKELFWLQQRSQSAP